MPTYRVYYAEREATEADKAGSYGAALGTGGRHETEPYDETQWEEEVEGRDTAEALDAFFKEHVRDTSEVRWVDEAGEPHEIVGLEPYDPDKTYVWIENDKLMEYQGIDEATPGKVTCPLCGGEGEVDEEVAEEFLAENEESDEVTWG